MLSFTVSLPPSYRSRRKQEVASVPLGSENSEIYQVSTTLVTQLCTIVTPSANGVLDSVYKRNSIPRTQYQLWTRYTPGLSMQKDLWTRYAKGVTDTVCKNGTGTMFCSIDQCSIFEYSSYVALKEPTNRDFKLAIVGRVGVELPKQPPLC